MCQASVFKLDTSGDSHQRMGHYLFLFVLLVASTILPSALANSRLLINQPAFLPSEESALLLPQADIEAFLHSQNTIRAKHGASPLAWEGLLANKAEEWASHCKFKHSGGTLGPYGGSHLNSWPNNLIT